jgi:hypothetical protein
MSVLRRHLWLGLLSFASVCIFVLGAPVRAVGQNPAESSAGATYDLVPRYQVGQTSFYRLTITLHLLGDDQTVMSRIQDSADMQREVVQIREDGAAVERITWKNYSRAEGQGRTGPLRELERAPWAEDFNYLFSAEDRHEDFHWDYSAIPVGRMGDAFMVFTVNAHFEFDFLRSRFHGAIDQLHRVGDSVPVPDTGRRIEISLRATPVLWTFYKRDHTMTFQGLSECEGRPCAVLAFWTWMDVPVGLGEGDQRAERQGNSQFDGHLYVDLRDGSLWRGDFNEWVTLPTLGPTGKELNRFYVEYRMERISPGT